MCRTPKIPAPIVPPPVQAPKPADLSGLRTSTPLSPLGRFGLPSMQPAGGAALIGTSTMLGGK